MTISITWADVEAIAPELATVATATKNAILADLPLQMNETVWAEKLNLGAKYLAAHLATISARRGAGGAIQSQSVGQVSRTFAASMASGQALFGSTSYGVIYEGLLMSLAAARFTIA